MNRPTILFLNGTSSAGKTSIAQALQATLDDPYLYFSADIRKTLLPPFREGLGWSVEEILTRLRDGYYGCLAAFYQSGNCVITDQAIEKPEWMGVLAEMLAPTRTFLIGVRCPLEVAEQRERERGDRTLGLVQGHFHLVHQVGIYDLEVDSSLLTPQECAERIRVYIADHEPTALQRIAALAEPSAC